MTNEELDQFIDEYTESLNRKLKEAAKRFPEQFNGLHVRALAQDMTTHHQESIKKARREVVQLEMNIGSLY